jgi:DNA-binding PadR family transcriptional regulator
MAGKPRKDPTAELPLKPVPFHILLVLSDGERHGYRLVQEIEDRTAGQLQLQAGNLYRTLRTMKERGLIDESTRRPAAAVDDARRRYFRITEFGIAVARAESARLQALVTEARARSLLTD